MCPLTSNQAANGMASTCLSHKSMFEFILIIFVEYTGSLYLIFGLDNKN